MSNITTCIITAHGLTDEHCISGPVSNDTEMWVQDMFLRQENFVGFLLSD